MTNDNLLQLRSDDYATIKGSVIFYYSYNYKEEEKNNIDALTKLFKENKHLVVTRNNKKNNDDQDWYRLYLDDYVVSFTFSEYFNLHIGKVENSKKAQERKKQFYDKTNYFFNIICEDGIELVGKNIDNQIDWEMDHSVINDLKKHMDNYFDNPQKIQKSIANRVSRKFKFNILTPFERYTEAEKTVEMFKQIEDSKIQYLKKECCAKNDNSDGLTYIFYTNDERVIENDSVIQIGDRVSVYSDNEDNKKKVDGTLVNIEINDDTSSGLYLLFINFRKQFDDTDISNLGFICRSFNDTQYKVRRAVLKSLDTSTVESVYMYNTFSDFTTEDYFYTKEEIENNSNNIINYLDNKKDIADVLDKRDLEITKNIASLTKFLEEQLKKEYPPNQMQMEAIIKGLLTKDTLLVLGPPGTGKTTVISSWVKFFIEQGKRVLISSQNNAAVDNVLARFGENPKAKILRIGNETKVQENCKEFLPQRKLDRTKHLYEENYKALLNDLLYNEKVLKYYTPFFDSLLKELIKTKDLKAKAKDFSNRIYAHLQDIKSKYEEIQNQKKDIENIELELERVNIFINKYNSGNIISKFLNRKYYKLAIDDLKKLKETSANNIEQLNILQEYYNQYVRSMKETITKFRGESLYSEIKKQSDINNFYINILNNEDDPQLPALRGILNTMYERVRLKENIEENIEIVKSQPKIVENLFRTIDDTKSALEYWNYKINNDRNDIIQKVLIEDSNIVGATCIGINSNRDFSNVKFDVAIVDESGQIQIHNALIPMSRAPINLLLGDYKQIPPCASDDVIQVCKDEDFDTKLLNMSFFEYEFEQIKKKLIKQLKDENKEELLKPVLDDYNPKKYNYSHKDIIDMIERVVENKKKLVNLNSQFRMPGNISDIISKWFYENNYYSSYNMTKFVPLVPNTTKPLVVISTSEEKNKYDCQPESGMGYKNIYEAKLIAEILDQICKTNDDFKNNIMNNVGIISAYGGQVAEIRKKVKEKLGLDETTARSIAASLDSFQGQERPLIIYSLTRSNTKDPKQARVGFMKELRRLNVAFTRCQKQLVIIGDIKYLLECEYINNKENIHLNCDGYTDAESISQVEINQCSDCSVECERKFARFMKLLMQSVKDGKGEEKKASDFLK